MTVKYPDVPDAPSVPPVFRSASNPGAVTYRPDPSTFVSPGGFAIREAWGIFDKSGQRALEPDSFAAVEMQREFRISTFPQENGGFQSYNKVATPFEIRVTVTKGGSVTDRNAFLAKIDEMVTGTDLFTVSQPERTYSNVNFTRLDYRRSSEGGVGLLIVEIVGEEVRVTAKGRYTTTKAPSGANTVNGGPVRPNTPTNAQTPAGAPQ